MRIDLLTLSCPRSSAPLWLAALSIATLLGSACGEEPGNIAVADAGADGDASAASDAGVPDAAAVPDAAPVADAGFSVACTVEELQPIAECAAEACADLLDLDAGIDPTALATCLFTNCGAELLALSPSCGECLTSAASGSLEELIATCTSGTPPTP